MPSLLQALSLVKKVSDQEFTIFLDSEVERINETATKSEFPNVIETSQRFLVDLGETTLALKIKSLRKSMIIWAYSFLTIKVPGFFSLENIQLAINEENTKKKAKLEFFRVSAAPETVSAIFLNNIEISEVNPTNHVDWCLLVTTADKNTSSNLPRNLMITFSNTSALISSRNGRLFFMDAIPSTSYKLMLSLISCSIIVKNNYLSSTYEASFIGGDFFVVNKGVVFIKGLKIIFKGKLDLLRESSIFSLKSLKGSLLKTRV